MLFSQADNTSGMTWRDFRSDRFFLQMVLAVLSVPLAWCIVEMLVK